MFLEIKIGPVDDYGRERLLIRYGPNGTFYSLSFTKDRPEATVFHGIRASIIERRKPDDPDAWDILLNALPSPYKERAEELMFKIMERKILGAG